MNMSGDIEGRDERAWLFPRGPVTPQATFSSAKFVKCTPCTRSCFIVPNVKSGLPRSAIASSCMPMSMCRAACAAGTARAAAKTRIAAKTPICLRNDRLPPEGGQHPFQPLFELDLWLPAEQLLGARAVWLAHLRVVDRQRLVDDLALGAGDAEHGFGQLVERELPWIAQVDRK